MVQQKSDPRSGAAAHRTGPCFFCLAKNIWRFSSFLSWLSLPWPRPGSAMRHWVKSWKRDETDEQRRWNLWKEKKKKRIIDSWNQLIRFFCVKNPVPLNYLSISMYPAATIMYMQSLPRPEPNYVSKSLGPITNPHTDTNGNPLPISKKKRPPKFKASAYESMSDSFFSARAPLS